MHVALCICLALTGCLQVETRITLTPTGGATVTERVRFSQPLLDLGKAHPELDISPMLEKPAVQARMAGMGKGVTLASHEIRPAAGGSKECVSVFKVDDINEFRYASPFLAYLDYGQNSTVQIKLEPLLKGRPYVGRAGTMAVSFNLVKPAKGDRTEPAKDKDGKPIPPPPGPSPASLQVLRDLGPACRDMLADFKIRLVFESYSPIVVSGIGWRGCRQGGREVDLINFSADDLDNYGNKFLENEPVMLDLVRGEVGAASVLEHSRGFVDNPTLPVFVPWGSRFAGWHGSEIICFRPSREMFNKYFVDEHGRNRKIDPAEWGPSPPDKLVEAKFEEIGYDPEKDKLHPAVPAAPVSPVNQPTSRPDAAPAARNK